MNVLVSHHCLLDEVRDGDPRLVQVRVGGQGWAALIVDVFLRLRAPVDRARTISDDVSLVSTPWFAQRVQSAAYSAILIVLWLFGHVEDLTVAHS